MRYDLVLFGSFWSFLEFPALLWVQLQAPLFPFEPGSSSEAVALCSMVPSLALTSLLSLGFALCASIPVMQLQYATFILQVVSRSFLYGCNAAFLTLA